MEVKKPFFAKFLEGNIDDELDNARGGYENTTKYPSDSDENPVTLKYPSDDDENLTLKYPSDVDDSTTKFPYDNAETVTINPGNVTLKYPSDDDEVTPVLL